MPTELPTTLAEVADLHFLWMLGRGEPPDPALRLPDGGVDGAEILGIVRRMTQRLHAGGSRGSWMIVSNGEVVGLCSYKQVPRPDGDVEIGYGVAKAHRERGHARRAVSAMLDYARDDPGVRRVVAATAIANIASQRALTRNGFVRNGTRNDPDDGELVFWAHDLS